VTYAYQMPILAFICTGPDTGFDPICDGGDFFLLIGMIVVAWIAMSIGALRLLRRRWGIHGWRKTAVIATTLVPAFWITSVLATEYL